MNPTFGRLFMVLACAFAATRMIRVTAAPLPEDDATKIRAIIVAQLEAFADDDADSAFAAATPAVREAIGAPALFLALVRGVYPMVYHPASVTFHRPEQDGEMVVQAVEIIDDEATTWVGLFAMEQQADASWRIRGCAVAETRWRSI